MINKIKKWIKNIYILKLFLYYLIKNITILMLRKLIPNVFF